MNSRIANSSTACHLLPVSQMTIYRGNKANNNVNKTNVDEVKKSDLVCTPQFQCLNNETVDCGRKLEAS